MNLPIAVRRETTIIIAAMIGTAITPLSTALQNRAFIGGARDQPGPELLDQRN